MEGAGVIEAEYVMWMLCFCRLMPLAVLWILLASVHLLVDALRVRGVVSEESLCAGCGYLIKGIGS